MSNRNQKIKQGKSYDVKKKKNQRKVKKSTNSFVYRGPKSWNDGFTEID